MARPYAVRGRLLAAFGALMVLGGDHALAASLAAGAAVLAALACTRSPRAAAWTGAALLAVAALMLPIHHVGPLGLGMVIAGAVLIAVGALDLAAPGVWRRADRAEEPRRLPV